MVMVLLLSACAARGGVVPATTTTVASDPGSPFETTTTTSSTTTTTTEAPVRLDPADRNAILDVTRDYAAALADAQWESLPALVAGAPDDLVEIYADTWAALSVEEASLNIIADRPLIDGPEVDVGITMTLRDAGDWDFPGTMGFVQDAGAWKIAWDPSIIHPSLDDGDVLRLQAEWPQRASILDVEGEPLVSQQPVSVIGVVPERITDLDALLEALEDLAGIAPAVVTTEIDRPGVQPNWFLPVGTMPVPEYAGIAEELEAVAGVLVREDTGRVAAFQALADRLLGTVGPITAEQLALWGPPYDGNDIVGRSGLELGLQEQLAGLPAISVNRVNQFGRVVETLASKTGTDPQPVQVTIDVDVQGAAEAALAAAPAPAAMVVLDIETGGIRAAVSLPAEEFDRALGGLYPPGSSFKIVTGSALLDEGISPDDPVDCPGEVIINGRVFRNAGDRDLGSVSFRTAFAESCNTTFGQLSGLLDAGELRSWAERFGFNTDYGLPVPAARASFPDPPDLATRAAAAIGQAQVLASPLQMASIAAAVAGGGWRAPTLLVNDDLPERRALDPQIAEVMAGLMLAAVTEGTGGNARVEGQVIRGKTGSAEFGVGDDLDTHAWFVGYWEDLAFAVVVEGGGSGGQVAAPIAADFVRRMLGLPSPPD